MRSLLANALVAALVLSFSSLSASADERDEELCAHGLKVFYEPCVAQSPREGCDSYYLQSYTQGAYSEVNRALRAGTQGPCRKVADILVRALTQRRPAPSRELWRGTFWFPELERLAVGDCLIDPAFLSTSTSEEIGREFSVKQGPGVLWKIDSASARDVSGISHYDREKEALLFPGTPLRLIRRAPDSRVPGVTFMEFEETSLGSCERDRERPRSPDDSRRHGRHPASFEYAESGEAGSDPYDHVANLAASKIVTTTLPLAVYTWNGRDSFAQGVDTFIGNSIGGTFEFSGEQRDALGPGLYYATDPVATRSFGGADWATLETILAPKLKFLDLRGNESGFEWGLSVLEALDAKYGCRVGRIRELFLKGHLKGCFELKKRLLADPRLSGAVGALYNYSSVGYFDCTPPYGPGKDPSTLKGMAMLIWSKDALQSSKLITAKDPLDSPDVGRLQAQFEARKSLYDNYMPLPADYPANGATRKPSQPELFEWLKRYAWACRPGL